MVPLIVATNSQAPWNAETEESKVENIVMMETLPLATVVPPIVVLSRARSALASPASVTTHARVAV